MARNVDLKQTYVHLRELECHWLNPLGKHCKRVYPRTFAFCQTVWLTSYPKAYWYNRSPSYRWKITHTLKLAFKISSTTILNSHTKERRDFSIYSLPPHFCEKSLCGQTLNLMRPVLSGISTTGKIYFTSTVSPVTTPWWRSCSWKVPSTLLLCSSKETPLAHKHTFAPQPAQLPQAHIPET